jgi:hypothetical protein
MLRVVLTRAQKLVVDIASGEEWNEGYSFAQKMNAPFTHPRLDPSCGIDDAYGRLPLATPEEDPEGHQRTGGGYLHVNSKGAIVGFLSSWYVKGYEDKEISHYEGNGHCIAEARVVVDININPAKRKK